MADYTALRSIQAPGTSVFGYRRGDEVPGSVVEDWALQVGTAADPEADVVEGPIPADEEITVVPARPGDGDNRAAWEGWAIAAGMTADQAAEASMEELMTADKPVSRKRTPKAKADDTVAVAATEANQDS